MGNMLIHPVIEFDESGTAIVEWYGLLSDWELAKPMKYLGVRQPERTVSTF